MGFTLMLNQIVMISQWITIIIVYIHSFIDLQLIITYILWIGCCSILNLVAFKLKEQKKKKNEGKNLRINKKSRNNHDKREK